MNKANILASQRYTLASENNIVSEYHLESILLGKLTLPLKIRLSWHPEECNVIILQFLDSPIWKNCQYHKLTRIPFSSTFRGQRRVQKWSITFDLKIIENGKAIVINLFQPNGTLDFTQIRQS